MSSQPTTVPRTWATLPEAAAYVGLSAKTLRRRIAEGRLPAYRFGGRATLRVKYEDLDAQMQLLPTAGGAR